MFSTQIDKKKYKIGFITERITGKGKTGYQIRMLIRRKEYIFDIAEDVFKEYDAGLYGSYPSTGEFLYIPQFDENGVIQQLIQGDTFGDEGGILKSHVEYGTTKMFVRKITESTPTVGDFFRIEGDKLIFENLDGNEDALTYLAYGGTVEKPHDGMTLQLAPDVDVYIWDWTKAKRPFSTSLTREEAIANDFVTHYEVGELEDIKKNGYWIDMVSTRGDENVIDLISCFLNQPPGWEG